MAKTPTKASAKAEPALAQIDSAKVLALMDRLKKLMGEPEILQVCVGGDVEVSAEYATGSVILYDKEAILTESPKDLRFVVQWAVLKNALTRRGPLHLCVKNNMLQLRGTKYNADLNIESAPPLSEFQPLQGQNSTPLKRLLAEASYLLSIADMIEATPIDVHFKWGKGQIFAGAADNYHAVLVRSSLETKSSHEVTMPLKLALKLAEIGGQFSLGQNQVQAESELGRVEMNQIGTSEALVPLRSIQGLLEREVAWSTQVSVTEMIALLDNLTAVVEWGQVISLIVEKDNIHIDAGGRYGKVSGNVPTAHSTGTAPEAISFNRALFQSLLGRLTGLAKISVIGNMLRIEPVEQSEWEFYGFVVLAANE